MEENKFLDPLAMMQTQGETYDEAVQKSEDESKGFQKTNHFRIDKDGTYKIRILPLVPIKQADGTYKFDRKGYEYPIKTHILRLVKPGAKKKDKDFYVNICHSRYAGISVDLVDEYLNVAEKLYGNDEKLMNKIKGNSFDGGLKWNSQRLMYIYNLDKKEDGIQLFALSYPQYKELEDTKFDIWKKVQQRDGENVGCPIASIKDAYPVEIKRKTDGKTKYTISVDTLSGKQPLSDEELKTLLETQTIPDAAYRYNKFHLEATIEFLKQYDKKNEMDVMSTQEIADVIAKIKMELPADDKSSFSFDKKNKDGDGNEAETGDEIGSDLDSLWDYCEKYEREGKNERSEEALKLRDHIREYLDNNEDITVRVVRGKSNRDILNDIEDCLERMKGKNDNDTPVDDDPVDEPEDTPTDDNDAADSSEDNDPVDEQEQTPVDDDEDRHDRGEHNFDNNEPAAPRQRERRAARPERQRRAR